MSNVKPLLFIETVQTKINPDIGQTILYQRGKKKQVTEQVQAVNEEPVQAKVEQVLTNEMSSKVLHQATLLDKRAKRNHFVYVEVVLKEGMSYQGFFKGLSLPDIHIQVEAEFIELNLNEVVEIKILRV